MHGDLQRGAVHPRRAALRGQNRREDDHEGLSAPSRGRALRPHRPVSALPGSPGFLHRRTPLFHRQIVYFTPQTRKNYPKQSPIQHTTEQSPMRTKLPLTM